MQKIMFNDNLCLTEAVLVGLKTHTRRGIPELKDIDSEQKKTVKVENVKDDGSIIFAVHLTDGERILVTPKFKIGEVVAISQSYKDVSDELYNKHRYGAADVIFSKFHSLAGWTNKMFVKADWMLHHIKITHIKIERLQDISEEDCIKEGIYKENPYELLPLYKFHGSRCFPTAYGAYEELINKLDKRMWKQNPLVLVFEFKLVD